MRSITAGLALLLVLAGCANQGPSATGAAPAGNTRTITGLNGVQGDIEGTPAPGSKFSRVQIGMPQRQVVDLIGQPNDTSAHITGKAFIPFYFGGDSSMEEEFYKGEGQLSYASDSIGSSARRLVRIIVDRTEQGYAH